MLPSANRCVNITSIPAKIKSILKKIFRALELSRAGVQQALPRKSIPQGVWASRSGGGGENQHPFVNNVPEGFVRNNNFQTF